MQINFKPSPLRLALIGLILALAATFASAQGTAVTVQGNNSSGVEVPQADTLDLSGSVTASALVSDSSVTAGTTLSTSGNATIGGDIAVTGGAAVGESLTVGVDGTFTGNIAAANFTGSSSGTNTGNVTVGSGLTGIIIVGGQELDSGTQTANTIFAGPTTGSAAQPTFRALVDADVPNTLTIGQILGNLVIGGTVSASNLSGTNSGNQTLSIDGSNLTLSGGGGTVVIPASSGAVPTSRQINTTAPLAGGGALTSDLALSIALADATTTGALKPADWTTFNAKQSAITFSSPLANNAGTVSIPAAATAQNGYLTSTDWNTFNGKQSALAAADTDNDGYLTFTDWNTFNGKQAGDATLTALAGVTTAADKLAYFTGTDTATVTDLTTFGRSLVDDAAAVNGRATLELATTSTDNALVRFDSTVGKTQNGQTTEDDSGNVTTAGNVKVGTGTSAATLTLEAGSGGPDVALTADSTGGSAKTFRVPSDNTVNANPNYAVWSRYRWNGTDGQPNYWIGDSGSGVVTTGVGNYAWGKRSMAALTSGYLNVAVGEDCLAAVTTGIANVAVGESNMMWLTTGIDNIAIGSDAGGGDEVGAGLETGNQNIFIGNGAGYVYQLGDHSDQINWGNNSDNNCIAIGLRASFGDIADMSLGAPYQRVVIAAKDGENDADNQIMLGRLAGLDTVVSPGVLESRTRLRVDDGATHSSNPGAINVYKGAGTSANGVWIESTAGAGMFLYQEDNTANSASVIQTFTGEQLKLNAGTAGNSSVVVTGGFSTSGNSTLGDANTDAHEVKGGITYNATTSAQEQIMTNYNSNFSQWTQRVYSNTAGHRPYIAVDVYGGTQASPSTVAAGRTIGSVLGRAWDGTNLRGTAEIGFEIPAGGTVSTSSMPSDVFLSNTLNGATTRAKRLIIDSTNGDTRPGADNAYDLGMASYRWNDVYATNGTIQTSDVREKKDIKDSELGLDFVKALRPVEFKWNDNPTSDTKRGREKHIGLIAQEVEAELDKRDVTDSGIYVYDVEADLHGLRMGELVPVLIKAVQEQQAQIDALEARIAQLERGGGKVK